MKINDFVVAILLLLLSFVAFYNSFDNAFLMDDFPMLVENLNIGDSAFLQVDPSAKSQVYFRPVTHILNLITYTYFKENPIGYHCVNLLLYYAAALVFYFLIKKVFHNSWMAFGAAALFIVHPINGVCVNYKNATGDALLVLAINIALLRGLRAAQKNSVQNQVLGLIWLLVALGCHEIAFAFPLYLAALLYSTHQYSWKKIWVACQPSVILLFIYFIFRTQFASLQSMVFTGASGLQITFWNQIANFAQIINWYLAKLVFLNDIVLIWNVPLVGQACWLWVAAFWGFVGTGAVLFWWFRLKSPAVALGVLWFAIGCVPVSFACFSRPWFGVIVEPFWLIYSSLGFFLIVSGLCFYFCKQRYLWGTLIILLYSLGVLLPTTWRYNDVWAQPIGYCQFWMRVSPQNFFPQFWLAYSLIKEKQYESARELLEQLLKRGLHYEWIYGNLGIAQYHLGHYQAARIAFSNALQLNDSNGDTHYYLGLVFLKLKDLQQAKNAFEQAMRLAPEIIDAKKQLEEIGSF
jgi:tetratricopeptide (TPR) repeat protein